MKLGNISKRHSFLSSSLSSSHALYHLSCSTTWRCAPSPLIPAPFISECLSSLSLFFSPSLLFPLFNSFYHSFYPHIFIFIFVSLRLSFFLLTHFLFISLCLFLSLSSSKSVYQCSLCLLSHLSLLYSLSLNFLLLPTILRCGSKSRKILFSLEVFTHKA